MREDLVPLLLLAGKGVAKAYILTVESSTVAMYIYNSSVELSTALMYIYNSSVELSTMKMYIYNSIVELSTAKMYILVGASSRSLEE